MHLKRVLTLTGVVVAAALVVASAGARTTAPSKTLDLTSRSGVLSYFRSLGIDTRTVVFQRGSRNYAGPSCPGQGWTCTAARHVVQFATSADGGNSFMCTPGTTDSRAPDTCVIVQVSNEGANTAVCSERSTVTLPAPSQSCSITQTNVFGPNHSLIDERVVQRTGGAQTASQDAQLVQQNGSGTNDSQLTQTIWQLTSATASSVSQSQDGEQTTAIQQNATSGPQTSTLTQFTAQRAAATGATGVTAALPVSGSQSQTGDGTATIDQHSTGVSTSDVNQQMNQQATAPRGSTVVQTQIGPYKCCSSQDSNPRDTFKLRQSKVQIASTLQPTSGLSSDALQAAGSSQFVTEWGELNSTGRADVKQVVTENGVSKRNTCTVTNGSCFTSTECPAGASCTTCSSTEFCCPPTECCTETNCCGPTGCDPTAATQGQSADDRRFQARAARRRR